MSFCGHGLAWFWAGWLPVGRHATALSGYLWHLQIKGVQLLKNNKTLTQNLLWNNVQRKLSNFLYLGVN
jgi:hypothetical protein